MADLFFGLAMAALFAPSGKDYAVDYDSLKCREAIKRIKSAEYLGGFGAAVSAVDELATEVSAFWQEYNNTISSLENCIKTYKTKIDYVNADVRACEANRKTYMDKAKAEGTVGGSQSEYLSYAGGESRKIEERQQEIAKYKKKIAELQEDLNDLYANKERVLKYGSDVESLKSALRAAASSADREADAVCKRAESAMQAIENYLSVRI